MYSDDDTIYAHDMETGEDDYYTDDNNDSIDDDEEHDHDSAVIVESHRSQVSYAVLNEEDIRRKQKDDIEQVSMVLSISEVEASILLLHYRWSVSKVNDEWFADEERVRRTVGILEGPVVVSTPHDGEEVTCGICFDSFFPKEIVPIACSHPFCTTCWTSYISISINDGPGCLMLKCPDPSCHVAVGRDMIDRLSCKEDRDKYNGYFLRSYVEDNRKAKWCPAPGCEYAIEFSAAGGGSSDVSCSCSHSFCWDCIEDAHRPVDCDTVAQWIRKNSSEAENTKWILANSKACPKCKRQIEKNLGCMHMTCTPPCRHQFCWLCLGAWNDHGERSGGYYACNRYEADKREGLYDEAEKRREMAKNSIVRYTHYYERWASNQMSRQKAMEDLQIFQSKKLEKLCEIQCTSETQLKFITDAWLQIIECRRVLKWTYAYGYYLPETDRDKRRFFEYLQGEAESGLERLHKCVENELGVFENAKGPLKGFDEFRVTLTGFTNATKTYFENLVKALENGLTDVDSQAASSKSTNLNSQAASCNTTNYLDRLFERPMSDEDIHIFSQVLDEDYISN